LRACLFCPEEQEERKILLFPNSLVYFILKEKMNSYFNFVQASADVDGALPIFLLLKELICLLEEMEERRREGEG